MFMKKEIVIYVQLRAWKVKAQRFHSRSEREITHICCIRSEWIDITCTKARGHEGRYESAAAALLGLQTNTIKQFFE